MLSGVFLLLFPVLVPIDGAARNRRSMEAQTEITQQWCEGKRSKVIIFRSAKQYFSKSPILISVVMILIALV